VALLCKELVVQKNKNMRKVFSFILFLSLLTGAYAQNNRAEKTLANQYLRDARIYRADGAFDQSIALLRKAMPIFKKLEMWSKYCRTQNLLSEHYEYEENWDSVKAIQELVLIESVRYLGKNNRFELNAYILLGEVHEKKTEDTLALKYLEEALDLIDRKPVGKQDLRTAVNSQIGTVYFAQAKYIEAQAAFEAAEIASAKKPYAELPVLAKHKFNYAKNLFALKQFDKALVLANESMKLLLPLYGENHAKIAENRILIAEIYAAKGDDLKAEENWTLAAQKLRKQTKNLKTFANIYLSHGNYYKEKGNAVAAKENWNKGIQFLNKEIGAYHPLIADYYQALAELYLEQKESASALNAVTAGLKSIMPITKDPYQVDLASGLFLSATKILQFYLLKQKIHWVNYQEHPQPTELEEILKTFKAAKLLKVIIDLEGGNAQKRNKLYLLEKQIALLAAEAAAARKDKKTLLEALEWERWNWKAYVLSKAWPKVLNRLDQELDEQEKSLATAYQAKLRKWQSAILKNENVDAFHTELNRLTVEYLNLMGHLEKEHPKHYYSFHQMSNLKLDQLEGELKNKAIVVFLQSDGARYYRFQMQEGDWSFKRIDLSNASCSDFLQNAKNPEMEEKAFGVKTSELYQLMMGDLFQKGFPEYLQIITDEGLSHFPFELLTTQSPEGKLKNWPFLFKQTAISYAFSIRDLLEKSPNSSAQDFLVLASNYKDRTPSDYATAKAWAEGHNPANKFRKKFKARILSNFEATETHFREEQLSNFQAVHMNYWVNASQNLPAIYLHYEYDSTYDGRLNLHELPDWSLSLLSLAHLGDSAALWEQQAALLLGLRASGVETVLWPAWEVSPSVSQALLVRYYQYLAEGQPKVKAWQMALVEQLKKQKGSRQLPYYWAAFRLTGHDGVLTIEQKQSFPWAWLGSFVGGFAVLLLVIMFVRKRK
jgi:flagellar biosynthesis regulator FlaF